MQGPIRIAEIGDKNGTGIICFIDDHMIIDYGIGFSSPLILTLILNINSLMLLTGQFLFIQEEKKRMIQETEQLKKSAEEA